MEFDDQDHISRLPSSILSHILSLLKTREAVTTSVLSTRWLRLWTSISSLVLDADNMLDQHKYSDINVSHMARIERLLIKMKRTVDFMENVDHYLSCVSEVQKLHKLKVCFTFRHNVFGHHLTRCITFALDRNVDEIDLCLLEEDQYFSAPMEGRLYVFPCELLVGRRSSCLKRLRLAHCELALPLGAPVQCSNIFSGFNAITTLELSNVDLVSVGHFQNLLGNCHNLENLSLGECGNIECLKIEYPFCQKLRYLNVKDCPHLRAIQLKGINVETLEYKGRVIEFSFWNAPRLRTAFSHVHDGRLVYSDIWPLTRLPIDLPQLETLTEIETANYLLKNATSLQKMTIDPRPRLYLGNGKWHLLEASESWSRIGKHKVYRHLTQQLCPPVELLIL